MVITLVGHLSTPTSVDVLNTLCNILAGHPSAILIDMEKLVVDDEAALTVFRTVARRAADWPGCPVLLCAADAAVRQALDRMGVSRYTSIHGDRAAALSAVADMRLSRRIRRTIPSIDTATAIARDMVRSVCDEPELAPLVGDGELIVTELVANVIRHVGGSMEVVVLVRERFLLLSVRDSSPVRSVRRLPDPETGEGGRGLLLIDAVATAWGTCDTVDGKVVWARLRIRG